MQAVPEVGVVGGGLEWVVVGGGVEWVVVGGGVECVVVGGGGAAWVVATGAEAWAGLDGTEAVVAVRRALCFALALWAAWWARRAWWVAFRGGALVVATVPVVAGDWPLVCDEAPQAAASSATAIMAAKENRIRCTRM